MFEPKCRVGAGVAIGSFCTVSAQCVLVPSSLTSTQEDLDALLLGADVGQPTTTGSGPLTIPEESEEDAGLEAVENSTSHAGADVHVTPIETIPDYTTIFASGQRRNKWSGQGMGQMEALHAKHLDYLRQCEWLWGKILSLECATDSENLSTQPFRRCTNCARSSD